MSFLGIALSQAGQSQRYLAKKVCQIILVSWNMVQFAHSLLNIIMPPCFLTLVDLIHNKMVQF